MFILDAIKETKLSIKSLEINDFDSFESSFKNQNKLFEKLKGNDLTEEDKTNLDELRNVNEELYNLIGKKKDDIINRKIDISKNINDTKSKAEKTKNYFNFDDNQGSNINTEV